CRLLLCALPDPVSETQTAVLDASDASGAELCGAPNYPRGEVEAGWRGRPYVPHHRSARRHHRTALHAPVGDQPIASSLVPSREVRRCSLPLVCAFELRIDARFGELPRSYRAKTGAFEPGCDLVDRLRCFRCSVCACRLEEPRGIRQFA